MGKDWIVTLRRRQRLQVAVALLLVAVGWATGFFTGSMFVLYPLALLMSYPVLRRRSVGELTEFAGYAVVGFGGLWFVLLLLDSLP